MKIAWYILSVCFVLNAFVVFTKDYSAGIKEGELRARTEAVMILKEIDRSGIMSQHYAQAVLNKYGIKTKLKIKEDK